MKDYEKYSDLAVENIDLRNKVRNLEEEVETLRNENRRLFKKAYLTISIPRWMRRS